MHTAIATPDKFGSTARLVFFGYFYSRLLKHNAQFAAKLRNLRRNVGDKNPDMLRKQVYCHFLTLHIKNVIPL
jgi:hypothetical protein